MLAYLSWVAGGKDCIEIPVSSELAIGVSCRPMIFESPVSLVGVGLSGDTDDVVGIESDEIVEDADWSLDDDIDEDEFDEDEVTGMEEGEP